jgi:hypothetical protein
MCSLLFLPYIATPILIQLSSQCVSDPSAGSAALAALAALATHLSNAAAPCSLSACAAASAGCFPLAAASLWRPLPFGGCFSSSSSLVASMAASFGKRKREEVSRAIVYCFPSSAATEKEEEETVSLAPKVAASLRKRKEVRAFVLRPPSVSGCATEPLPPLLLHLLADLALVPCPVLPILVLLRGRSRCNECSLSFPSHFRTR